MCVRVCVYVCARVCVCVYLYFRNESLNTQRISSIGHNNKVTGNKYESDKPAVFGCLRKNLN